MGDAIRPAHTNDIAALNRIERLTDSAHFSGILRNPDSLPLDTPDLLESACNAKRLWVATDDADRPVGHCFVRMIGGSPHIEEVSVHPDHGRRGLGRRLVETALAWARTAGHLRITLTTFRELPWNGPFYAPLGFTEVAPAHALPDHRALLDEKARGLVPDPAYRGSLTRVLMMRELT